VRRAITVTASGWGGKLEKVISEKFSMVYMEVQTEGNLISVKNITNKRVKVFWHIEDEHRPTVALCGRTLHGNCKSVSPALAMFGTPCPACQDIVAEYINGPAEETTKTARLRSMVQTDMNFREHVTKVVDPHKFNVNLDPPPVPEKKPETKKRTVSRGK